MDPRVAALLSDEWFQYGLAAAFVLGLVVYVLLWIEDRARDGMTARQRDDADADTQTW